MLLCRIVNQLKMSMDNLPYFFYQATDSGINSTTAVL
jgi:hypothetical protein